MTQDFFTYRLLTGSILAHEMMHAWLRLKGVCLSFYCSPVEIICVFDMVSPALLIGGLTGYRNLRPEAEEGICQVLAHMWLESEIYSASGSDVASSSSSSAPSSSSTKGKRSDFEKKLGEFFKHQIEFDRSPAYGDGFRIGKQAVLKYTLKRTLDHIQMTGSFPC